MKLQKHQRQRFDYSDTEDDDILEVSKYVQKKKKKTKALVRGRNCVGKYKQVYND